MPVTSSWRSTFAAAFAFDRSKLDLGFTLRCAAGVAIPLLAGEWAGNPAFGVAAAAGALNTGFASQQGIYRTRVAAMLLTAAGMGIAAFVGDLAEGSVFASIIITTLAAYTYGIVACLGPVTTSVAINAMISLIIFGRLGLSPGAAAVQALLICGGGVLQTILLVGVWPFRRNAAERERLALAYTALARTARSLAAGEIDLPPIATIEAVRAALGDPQPFARKSDIVVFQALLDEAERVRLSLAALATDRARYRSIGARRADAAVREALDACAAPLDDIAASLRAGRTPSEHGDEWLRIEEFERQLSGAEYPVAESVAREMRAVFGQLRSAWRIASAPAGEVSRDPASHAPVRASFPSARESLTRMRASLSIATPYGRHAVRLAIAVAVASTAAHLFPIGRGYWVVLTTVLVLRPDYATTLARGIARIAGTFAGALLAAAIALTLHPTIHLDAVLTVGFATIAYLVFASNYGFFSLAVTGYVVFLLAIVGQSDAQSVRDRLLATAAGGLIATLAILLFPTWEAGIASERLADLLDAQRAFAGRVLGALIDPAARDFDAIHDAQIASWQARLAAEASVARAVAEPSPALGMRDETMLGILAASRRFALEILALDARLAHLPEEPIPELAPFATALLGALERNAGRVHAMGGTSDPQANVRAAELREAYDDSFEKLAARSSDDDTFLRTAGDELVDSTNSMSALIDAIAAPRR